MSPTFLLLSKPVSDQAGVGTWPKLLDLPDCRTSSTGTAMLEWVWQGLGKHNWQDFLTPNLRDVGKRGSRMTHKFRVQVAGEFVVSLTATGISDNKLILRITWWQAYFCAWRYSGGSTWNTELDLVLKLNLRYTFKDHMGVINCRVRSAERGEREEEE